MAVPAVDTLKAAYQTNWEQLQPYLKAFVGGKHAEERFTEEDYARYRRDRNRLWGWSAAITIALCVFTQAVGIFAIAAYAFVSFIGPMLGVATMHAVNEMFGNGVNTGAMEKAVQFLGATLLLAAVPWAIARSAYGHGRMKRVRARQYYLRNFKLLHAKRSANFNWSAACFWLWPAYRGLLAWAGALCVLMLALLWVDGHMHVGKLPAWYRGARLAVIAGLFIASGMMATEIYFRHAMRAVAAALALPQEAALKKLQSQGGTRGWLVPLLLVALIYAAQFVAGSNAAAMQDAGLRTHMEKMAAVETQQDKDAIDADFSKMLKALEKSGLTPGLKEQHPELFIDAPQYDHRLVTEVMWRTRQKLGGGMTPEQATVAAIREIEVAKGAAKPH